MASFRVEAAFLSSDSAKGLVEATGVQVPTVLKATVDTPTDDPLDAASLLFLYTAASYLLSSSRCRVDGVEVAGRRRRVDSAAGETSHPMMATGRATCWRAPTCARR